MPNREKWSVTRTEGNPTQSKDMLDLLKAMKKKEVQMQGAKSLLEAGNDIYRWSTAHGSSWKRFGIIALVNFQFHMIA